VLFEVVLVSKGTELKITIWIRFKCQVGDKRKREPLSVQFVEQVFVLLFVVLKLFSFFLVYGCENLSQNLWNKQHEI
jgi:hypothetical protein